MNADERSAVLQLMMGLLLAPYKLVALIPKSRPTRTDLGASTLEQNITIPGGKYVKGFLVNLRTYPTGTGTGTAFVTALLKKLGIVNEFGEPVVSIEGGQGALTNGSAILQGIRKMQNEPGIHGLLAQDILVVAGTPAYYNAWALIPVKARGKEFTATMSLEAASVLSGLTVTGISNSMQVIALMADEPNTKPEIVSVEKRATHQADSYKSVVAAALSIENVELSTVLSSMQLGIQGVAGPTEIQDLEAFTNLSLQGVAAAGAATDTVFIPGINSTVHATNDMFVATLIDEETATLTYKFASAQTVYVALVRDAAAYQAQLGQKA